MPVYNAEKYIRESIESVLNQFYNDWELIIIDDGSTDNSFKIIQKYQKDNSKIRCYTKKNSGVAETRNLALSMVKGDYILFLDADDFIDVNTLNSLSKALEDDAWDIIVYNIFRVDETAGAKIKITYPFDTKPIMITDKVEKKHYIYSALCGDSAFGLIGNFAVRREIISDIHFDASMIMCEDLIFDMAMYEKAEKILCLPDYFYYYRNNPAGAVNNFNYKKIKDIKIAYEAKLAMIERYALIQNNESEKALLFFCGSIIQLYFGVVENRRLCKEYIKTIMADEYIVNNFKKLKNVALPKDFSSPNYIFGNILERLYRRKILMLKRKAKKFCKNKKEKML